jgi:uncharacterized membrane protein AbrB (regulator of aidB expression)
MYTHNNTLVSVRCRRSFSFSADAVLLSLLQYFTLLLVSLSVPLLNMVFFTSYELMNQSQNFEN